MRIERHKLLTSGLVRQSARSKPDTRFHKTRIGRRGTMKRGNAYHVSGVARHPANLVSRHRGTETVIQKSPFSLRPYPHEDGVLIGQQYFQSHPSRQTTLATLAGLITSALIADDVCELARFTDRTFGRGLRPERCSDGPSAGERNN
jgi:hypothetical protein